MPKSDNSIPNSLAASTKKVTHYRDKTSDTRVAFAVINTEEDKEYQIAQLSSNSNNGNDLYDEEIRYTRYYEFMIVTVSFLVLMMSFGIGNSWGMAILISILLEYYRNIICVFQDYFDKNIFGEQGRQIPNAGVQLSFVGTLGLCFEHSMAPLSEVIRSIRGAKTVLFIGTIFIFGGLIAASFAKEIWHLYLSQSILFGTGTSFLFSTIQTVTPHYFRRNPGLVLGVIASGASVGSLVIPLVVTTINNKLGIQWTYRMLGCANFIIDILSCVIIRDHPYNTNIRLQEKSSKVTLVRLDVFRNKNYRIWCLAAFAQVAAFFVPLFFIPSYATYIGLSDSKGALLVSVTSAAAFVGRISSGFIADRIGPVNISIIFTIIAGLCSLVIWPFAFTYTTLISFVIIFGFTSGTYYSLGSPITASILNTEEFSSGVTVVLLLAGIAVFGPSIASAVDNAGVSKEPFFTFKMFTGLTTLVSAVAMIWLKFSMKRNILGKV